jgi:hypothetical protein
MGSIFITSGPWAASIVVQYEPKMWSVMSTTRIPSSILSISVKPLFEAGHEDPDLPHEGLGLVLGEGARRWL